MKITVFDFYPDLLDLFSDSGNIIALKKRCEWRGIEVEIKRINGDEKPDFCGADIVFIGGGADKETFAVAEKLQNMKAEFKAYAENNGVLLGICGGYQLLGEYFETEAGRASGLGILDMYSVNSEERIVSNVILETEFGTVTGFENHKSKTYIKSGNPLGKVVYGKGNNGEDGTEGLCFKNVFGSYLHGPLLPKNPVLCDELIKRALRRKYGENVSLEELDDAIERKAGKYITDRFLKG